MATYCVTKYPKKPPFSKDSINLLIFLILHDKARFCLSGMKLAIGSMTMVSELRRGETFEKYSISFKIKACEDFNHRNTLSISRIKI